jgi:hypothetical protein
MQCFGTFRPLNIEKTTLPQNVGDPSPGDKNPHATRTKTSRWKCAEQQLVARSFVPKKKKRTKINKIAFVAVLLGIYFNLCILVLNNLCRINGYKNATTILESNF